jgi:hypothetical protein
VLKFEWNTLHSGDDVVVHDPSTATKRAAFQMPDREL